MPDSTYLLWHNIIDMCSFIMQYLINLSVLYTIIVILILPAAKPRFNLCLPDSTVILITSYIISANFNQTLKKYRTMEIILIWTGKSDKQHCSSVQSGILYHIQFGSFQQHDRPWAIRMWQQTWRSDLFTDREKKIRLYIRICNCMTQGDLLITAWYGSLCIYIYGILKEAAIQVAYYLLDGFVHAIVSLNWPSFVLFYYYCSSNMPETWHTLSNSTIMLIIIKY